MTGILSKLMSALLSAATVFGAVPVGSEGPAPAYDFEYNIEDGGVVITGYHGDDECVVIPAEIDGLPVRTIGLMAFTSLDISGVIIPDSVTTIEFFSFFECCSLEYVSIPSSVENIVGNFICCEKLDNFCVDERNLNYTAVDGVIFSKDKKTLAAVPGGRTSYEIPDGTETVGAFAFEGCELLESVTIPDSVTTIGYEAFAGCSALERINIPRNVADIEQPGFASCEKLTAITVDKNSPYYMAVDNVLFTKDGKTLVSAVPAITCYDIPYGTETVYPDAFCGCICLEKVTIPPTVRLIGMGAFSICTSLKSVDIPDSVTEIGKLAFAYCDELEDVSILDSVTEIGDGAFDECERIRAVYKGKTYDYEHIGDLYDAIRYS